MMRDTMQERHASSAEVTELILRIFRVNGALLAAGDRLVGGLGLTSARWQVLGGIAGQDDALTVAQLARTMGVTRQAVQRVANELEKEGVIAFRTNPRHRRAHLIALTERGRDLFERAMAVQQPWAESLGRTVPAARLSDARETLDLLLAALGATGMPVR